MLRCSRERSGGVELYQSSCWVTLESCLTFSHSALPGGNEQKVVPTGRHINQLVAQTKATKERKDTFSERTRIAVSPTPTRFVCVDIYVHANTVSPRTKALLLHASRAAVR